MFNIQINTEQKEYAWKLVNSTNFGKRGYDDGRKEDQYTGILGEVVMADVLGMARPDGLGGNDHGIDFRICEKNIDLKTMGRNYPVKDYFTNNLKPHQVSAPNCMTDLYLFSSINKMDSVMTFIGYFKKDNIEDRHLIPAGTPRPRGKSEPMISLYDNYEIDCCELSPVNNHLDLVWAIDKM